MFSLGRFGVVIVFIVISKCLKNPCDIIRYMWRSTILNSIVLNFILILFFFVAAPSYIRVTPSQVVLEEGNSYTLTCEADGDPAPLYEWYYKDIKIHEGNVLIISNAAYKLNDGLHTCKASNKIGSRQVTVDVDVKCKYTYILMWMWMVKNKHDENRYGCFIMYFVFLYSKGKTSITIFISR